MKVLTQLGRDVMDAVWLSPVFGQNGVPPEPTLIVPEWADKLNEVVGWLLFIAFMVTVVSFIFVGISVMAGSHRGEGSRRFEHAVWVLGGAFLTTVASAIAKWIFF